MKRHWLPLSVSAWLVFGTALLACNVPVFRYALERWPADLYELVILKDGPLDEPSSARVDRLRTLRTDSSANFNVRIIDVSQSKDELLIKLWEQHGKSGEQNLTGGAESGHLRASTVAMPTGDGPRSVLQGPGNGMKRPSTTFPPNEERFPRRPPPVFLNRSAASSPAVHSRSRKSGAMDPRRWGRVRCRTAPSNAIEPRPDSLFASISTGFPHHVDGIPAHRRGAHPKPTQCPPGEISTRALPKRSHPHVTGSCPHLSHGRSARFPQALAHAVRAGPGWVGRGPGATPSSPVELGVS